MARVRKLNTVSCILTLLFIVFYIVCFTKLVSWSNLIINSDIVNNQNGQGPTDLKQEGGEVFPAKAAAEELETFKFQNISKCKCSRKWMYPPTTDHTGSHFKRLNSSCSDEGTQYQTGQNVITFSMLPSEKPSGGFSEPSSLNYQIALLQNLKEMRRHYLGYSIRVYTSVPLYPGGYFCTLLCQNEDLFWCDIRETPSHGDLSGMNFRTWRFLTMGDPTVKIFHSRDLDSLIGHREAAAVQDWLNHSGINHKAIMAMKDHIYHSFPILAGLWGADNSKLLGKGDKLREKLILQSQLPSSSEKGFDQKFLSSELFYPMAKDILVYDSYHCKKWSKFTEVRPFPVEQTHPATGGVGNVINFSDNMEPGKWDIVKCPIKCRPWYGLNWKYC